VSGAYYNEHDPKAAAWLRELIKQGHIAPGVVDERSIEDITPAELAGYTQCHFFAGIGVWSFALRRAGWPDTRRVWTGSCPCQPLSQAGKGLGFADERHLWPAWYHLVEQCRPPVIFGEQVASKAADSWADLVQDDLEAVGYAFGAVPFPAASVGAPHIRDRLYWCAVADTDGRDSSAEGLQRSGQPGRDVGGRGELGDPGGGGSGRDAGTVLGAQSRAERCLRGELDFTVTAGVPVVMADSSSAGLEIIREQQARRQRETAERGGPPSFWDRHEYVWCRDGKWRPVEPGTFPLAHGAPARVGRLRGYGNAIVSEAAKVFIEESGLL
jgi:DNA (cytosine-5)-methyltransferase 1